MSKLSIAVANQNPTAVLKCLQESDGVLLTQKDLDEALRINDSEDMPTISIMLILSGANGSVILDNEWSQAEMMYMLKMQNVSMKLVTMSHIAQIEDILSKSEPPDAPKMNYPTKFTLEELATCATFENANNFLREAIFRGQTEYVKWLVIHRRAQSTGLPLYLAAMGQHVTIAEFLIASGARMYQYTPKYYWPWWVQNTQRRVLKVCGRVNQAIWIVRLQLTSLFPPEIAELIVGYLRASVFDLAVWKGQYDWKKLEQDVRRVFQ